MSALSSLLHMCNLFLFLSMPNLHYRPAFRWGSLIESTFTKEWVSNVDFTEGELVCVCVRTRARVRVAFPTTNHLNIPTECSGMQSAFLVFQYWRALSLTFPSCPTQLPLLFSSIPGSPLFSKSLNSSYLYYESSNVVLAQLLKLSSHI